MNTIDMPVWAMSDCSWLDGLNQCLAPDLWRKNVENFDFEVAPVEPANVEEPWRKPGQVSLARRG
jgi:hypothetical protein